LFLFFVPSIVYARICHQKAFAHLGYHHRVNYRQLAVVILIMLACLPLVGALADLTSKLPFSKATFAKFQAAEDAYNKQVAIIGRMDNFMDYILSLLMLAILPALFEETLFRGAIQNLLSRWWKAPVLAIVVTACIFSAVHGSYLGFLSRAALGFVLGWMYYRTGNLWLNIIAHAANNAVAITVLYVMRLKDPNVDLSKADPHYPMWWGIVAVAFVYGLFFLFEKVSNYQVSQPGKEILIETNDNNQPPWTHTTGTTQNA
jgi:membrane protease YdiL (CAAX protease family)